MSDRTSSQFQNRAAQRDDIAVISHTIDAQKEKYAGLLPSNVTYDAFRNSFLTAVQTNPSLLSADRQSLWLALQRCAGDGLKPDGREAALVIFNQEEDEDGNQVAVQQGGKQRRVVYMPMIRGLIKLVRNTGRVASIDVPLVYEGDSVEQWYEDGERHFRLRSPFGRDFDDSPERIIGAIAIVRYTDGNWEMERMSRRQIDRVRAVSRAKKGPWLPWYDEMAKKTVLRRLLKRLDTSSELRMLENAIDADETMPITIEGEKPTEQPMDSAGEGRAVVEFRGPPPSQRSPDPDPAQQRNAAPKAEPAREPPPPERSETERPAVRGAQSARAAAPEPGTPRGSDGASLEADDMSFFPCDRFGEPAESGGELLVLAGAVPFAKWFAAAAAETIGDELDALMAHNADSLAEAGRNPAAGAIIDAGIRDGGRAKRRQTTAAPAAPTAAAQLSPFFVAVPRTPKGAVHWPNYVAGCAAAITSLGNDGDLDAWIAANEPTYRGHPAAQRVGDLLLRARERLAETEGAPEASEREDAPDAHDEGGEPQPGPDPQAQVDERFVARCISDLADIQTGSLLTTWSRSIAARVAEIKARNKDAFDRIDAAVVERMRVLGVPPRGQQAPGP